MSHNVTHHKCITHTCTRQHVKAKVNVVQKTVEIFMGHFLVLFCPRFGLESGAAPRGVPLLLP